MTLKIISKLCTRKPEIENVQSKMRPELRVIVFQIFRKDFKLRLFFLTHDHLPRKISTAQLKNCEQSCCTTD